MKLSHASLTLALFAAACAASPPPPPPEPPKPVYTPDTIDGLYRGTSTRYQADSRTCPSPGLVTVRVVGGQFTYRWKYHVEVPATIQSDGSIQGSLGGLTLTGQYVPSDPGPTGPRPLPPRLQGDVTDGICGVHYTVTRRG